MAFRAQFFGAKQADEADRIAEKADISDTRPMPNSSVLSSEPYRLRRRKQRFHNPRWMGLSGSGGGSAARFARRPETPRYLLHVRSDFRRVVRVIWVVSRDRRRRQRTIEGRYDVSRSTKLRQMIWATGHSGPNDTATW